MKSSHDRYMSNKDEQLYQYWHSAGASVCSQDFLLLTLQQLHGKGEEI